VGIRHIHLLFPGDPLVVEEPETLLDPAVEPEPAVLQSIFTDQLPQLINQQDTTYTLGTLFKSDADGLVHGIRAYVGDVPTTSPQGLLYEWISNSQGTLKDSKVFDNLVPNSWNEVLFDEPLSILAETVYVAAWGPTNRYCATPAFFVSNDLVNGHLSALRNLTSRLNGKFKASGSATYPDESYNDGCYFVDVLFEAI
jgi:hypothetical protein